MPAQAAVAHRSVRNLSKARSLPASEVRQTLRSKAPLTAYILGIQNNKRSKAFVCFQMQFGV